MRTRVWLASQEGGRDPAEAQKLEVCEVLCGSLIKAAIIMWTDCAGKVLATLLAESLHLSHAMANPNGKKSF